jgi:sortase A
MTAVKDAPTSAEVAPAASPARRRGMRLAAARRIRRLASPNRSAGPRAPRTRSVAAGVTMWVSLALAGILGWTALYALAVSALQEQHNQSVLYSKLREELALATAPLGGAITPGDPVALMSMPSAGLRDIVVVEGTASGDLTNGPGHRRDTPLPGQAGISVVYGRATLFGGPFGDIASSAVGDPITVTSGQGVAKYRVIDVRRAGDPFPPPLAAGKARLTLVTADGSGWRNGWASNHVVYVDADLQGTALPAPSGRPAAVPTAEMALQGDPSGLYTLVFWLPLLGIIAVLVVWMSQRWGGWQTWVIAVPVVLAGLWGVTESAVRLLPNLL